MVHGHDVHFLERLERLSTPHTELALSLYQDPLLIRALLEQIRLPDGATRIALSLADGDRGPFVVVARDGHFVTCLAEGMSPGDHPVIARGQLDAIARRVDEVRNRFDAVRQLAGRHGNVFALLGRIFSAGPWLSREEFSAIAAFQPLLKRDFLRLLWETNSVLDRTRPLAGRCVKRGRLGDDILRAWWNEVWAVGHLSVLANMDSRDVIAELPAEAPERGLLSWPAVRQGVVAVALRGVWGVAKLGKPLLPDYKRWYVESESSLELVDSALGLLGIGLRQRGAAAEVRKALARENRAAAEGRPAAATIPQIQSIIEELTALVIDRPDDCAQLHVALGRMHVTKKTEDAGELPEDIARLLAVNSPATFVSSREGLVLLFASLPWVSRAQPEDLYWPTEHLEAIRQKWHPEQAAGVLRDTQVANPAAEPARVQAAPGRNEPCPCGSGKKYKRCHGL
jgi:alkylhydroperoxidase family enzyme